MKLKRRNLKGASVWIVGASSGIGAALAEEMHRRGAQVAISARRAERLAEVSAGRMTEIPVDVTDVSGIEDAAAKLRDQFGKLDMVVFSAGFWDQTDATEWDREVVERHVQVNLLGMNNCLAAVLPSMIEHEHGQFVGLASVAGYRGLAGAEAYGATKAAQINMLEAVRAAVADKGVDVTTVCPGFVKTELTDKNSFPMPFIIEPEKAANAICDGLERGQVEIVFPLPMALLAKTARLLPVRLWAWLGAKAQKRSPEMTKS